MKRRCKCGTVLSAPSSLAAGMCGRCRQSPFHCSGTPRVLYPGDMLMEGDGRAIGFVWDVRGDEIEVRSYNLAKPTIRVMTRAKASAYRIVPNESYGTDRPLLEER